MRFEAQRLRRTTTRRDLRLLAAGGRSPPRPSPAAWLTALGRRPAGVRLLHRAGPSAWHVHVCGRVTGRCGSAAPRRRCRSSRACGGRRRSPSGGLAERRASGRLLAVTSPPAEQPRSRGASPQRRSALDRRLRAGRRLRRDHVELPEPSPGGVRRRIRRRASLLRDERERSGADAVGEVRPRDVNGRRPPE